MVVVGIAIPDEVAHMKIGHLTVVAAIVVVMGTEAIAAPEVSLVVTVSR